MSYEFILYEEKDEIGVLTLNRPEKRNAFTAEFEHEIIACLNDAGERADVKVIIIKANGEVFCAGHDREEILHKPVAYIRQLMNTSIRMTTAFRSVPQCIIGQVHGIAIAGGCHLAAACDLVTAGEKKATFGMTGLLYSYNCSVPSVSVGRAIPQKRCMEMLMTARQLSAKEAFDFHLVNRVFPDDQLDELTYAWAKEICAASKYAIHMAKSVFYSQIEMTEWQAYQYTKDIMAMSGVSVNATEGFDAFIEKREPVWDESTCW